VLIAHVSGVSPWPLAADTELLSIVKVTAELQIPHRIRQDDDYSHGFGFRRSRTSAIERNCPFPAPTLARRAASTSLCQSGEATASPSREIEFHNCSIAQPLLHAHALDFDGAIWMEN
jgi:hypothetical protein